MAKKCLCVLSILIAIIIASCNRAQNYKDAYLVRMDHKYYISLRGTRRLLVHDFGSLLKDNIYEDSVLIPLPVLGNRRIPGKEIVFDYGDYKYSYRGWMDIHDSNLTINLYSFDTVSGQRKKEEYSWNGKYVLHAR